VRRLTADDRRWKALSHFLGQGFFVEGEDIIKKAFARSFIERINMSENKVDVQYRMLVIGERPYCVWGTDIQKMALEFLSNLDASYFEYLANTHIQLINEEQPREKESQFSALALRTIYSQGIETLFALLGAALQSPQCIHAWVDNYQPRELYSLVRKIHNQQPFYSLLNKQKISWEIVADTIFESLVLEDKAKETVIKKDFANLWSQFAFQFLDEGFSKEYNSIKHGLRVRPGGFSIAFGDNKGRDASTKELKLIGKSEFGSHYIASQKIGEISHHLTMKSHYRNWSPEDLSWGLHLISLSIANIKAALQILNGIPATEVKFQWPIDREVFHEPWKRALQIGVTSASGFQMEIHPDFIDEFSKEDILSRYKLGKDRGVKSLIFLNKENSKSEYNESPH
jgi:hypothetical protein